MHYSSFGKFHAFCDNDSFSVIENQKQRIISEIQSQKDDYILNVNKTEYIDYLISRYRIKPIKIHNDQLFVSLYEAMIPAEYHPATYFVKAVKCQGDGSIDKVENWGSGFFFKVVII